MRTRRLSMPLFFLSRLSRLFLLILLILLTPGFACSSTRAPEPLPVPGEGWIGGDIGYSRLLASGKRLWVFGDSLVGARRGGKRDPIRFFRNSVAVEQKGAFSFFWGNQEKGVFVNERPAEW